MKKLVCTLAAVLLVSLFCASALAAIPVNANVAALIGEDGKIAWVKVYEIRTLPDFEEVLAVLKK